MYEKSLHYHKIYFTQVAIINDILLKSILFIMQGRKLKSIVANDFVYERMFI